MIKVSEYNTYDRINLRDLCNEIISFCKDHRSETDGKDNSKQKKLTNYLSRDAILKMLLPGTDEWRTEINKLNKLASGNIDGTSLLMIPANIEQSGFRISVMKECAALEQEIRSVKGRGSSNMNGREFLQRLMDSCNTMFFKEQEFSEINECFQSESVVAGKNFIGLLFLHVFDNVAINLPHLSADRIFREALSLSPNSAMYIKLMKCAADNGHEYAALIYANHIYEDDINTALEYFILASGLRQHYDSNGGRPAKSETESNALWEIAYMFENHKLGENKIRYVDNIVCIDKRLEEAEKHRNSLDDSERLGQRYNPENTLHIRDYILGFSFDKNEVNQVTQYAKDKCVVYALKLYLYIAKKDLTFPKAFNSLGKIILGDYLSSSEDVPQKDMDRMRFALAKNYLDTAIHFGNTNAMVNLAVYYHNRMKLGKHLEDSEKQEMRYYLETAAKFEEREAQQHLGEILMSEGNYKEAQKYLEYAADRNVPNACHSLGKVYAFNFRDEEAIKCFEKALTLGCSDAAYDLAELYMLRLSIKEGEPMASTYRQYAVHLLNERMPLMSNEYKEKSEKLLEENKPVIQ